MYNGYKNPFTSFNTNGMNSEQISELFADPFNVLNKRREDISNDKSSILFVGSRGTGKTMLLRQFSYNVQRVSLNGYRSFFDKVNAEKYLGVYFRVDNALIKSLDSMSDYASGIDMFSEKMFVHYFELTIFKDLLEIVKIFLAESNISIESDKYKAVTTAVSKLIDADNCFEFGCVDDVIKHVVLQINYIWEYQSKKAIDITDTVSFKPNCGLIMKGRLTDEFLNKQIFELLELFGINVLLLIDEFESFTEGQQRVLNTAMRFTKECGVRYRIGMRPYGFKTYGTLDDNDFIKKGRDYQEVELDFPFISKGQKKYIEFVREIANKRLLQVSHFNDKDIECFLGKAEDLEKEANEKVKGRKQHINEYLRLINEKRKEDNKSEISREDFNCLEDANPLFEMENLLLLLRGNEMEYVTQAFEDYKNKTVSEYSKKYSNDYDKKYKLCFLFILCTIYRAERKWYYGFKDYCQMSSGIIGHFIELCRQAFDKAFFRAPDELFNGHISPEIQTEAAYDVSRDEFESIARINEYGNRLEIFIKNLGNAFSCIHKDKYIRYPETNLFPVSGDLCAANKKLIEMACMWSLIIKKPNLQDASASGEKKEIYFINRMLAPAFKISYRTRGGLNPIIVTDDYFNAEFKAQSAILDKKKKTVNVDDGFQLTLDFFENDNNGNSNFDAEDVQIDIDIQEDE